MQKETVFASAKIEVPKDIVEDGLYVVCIAFRLRENAEAAARMLLTSGIKAEICELRSEEADR